MTKEEYEKRFADNTKIDGFGFDTTTHHPCPFCAAPDFLSHKILEVEIALEAGSVCKECKRGSRAIMVRTENGVTFEFVQTCGDDPPDYIPPMRRV